MIGTLILKNINLSQDLFFKMLVRIHSAWQLIKSDVLETSNWCRLNNWLMNKIVRLFKVGGVNHQSSGSHYRIIPWMTIKLFVVVKKLDLGISSVYINLRSCSRVFIYINLSFSFSQIIRMNNCSVYSPTSSEWPFK